MNRRTARAIHSTTNLAYWIENPNWHTGNSVSDGALEVVRKLPVRVHEPLKRLFFANQGLIAVNGETVVVANGEDLVDKFMFRYPGNMSLENFYNHVGREVDIVCGYLARVALPTVVAIKPARIFRNPHTTVNTVAQTQERLDLATNVAFNLNALQDRPKGAFTDRAARGLERLVWGAEGLVANFGYYPDIGNGSGNLRIDTSCGAINLIDAMPFYADGNRLIDDRPPNVIPRLQENIADYTDFVGQYGG